LENVTAHLTMVQNFSPEWRYKINGVLWSISIEFQLYLLFPLLVWGLWKFGRVGIVGLLSALVFPVLILLPEARQFHLWFLPLFALGMAGAHAAVISKTAPERTRKIVGWAALGLGLLAAFLCTQTNQSWIYDSVGGLSVVLLLVLGAWNPNGPVARFFQLKWLLWMGAFSYSLYLMHHPIMQVLFFYRPSWFTTPVRQTLYLSLFGIPVILILCWLYYLAFEKPFISRKAAQSS
jgi:peptidoglycan/LPS O-acetylase OafA/YrhL